MKIKLMGSIITGKTPSTKLKDNFDGEIPFITPEDISKGFIVPKLSEPFLKRVIAQ